LGPQPNKKVDTFVTPSPWSNRQTSGISARIGNRRAIPAGNVGVQVLGFLCQSDDALMNGRPPELPGKSGSMATLKSPVAVGVLQMILPNRES
jgi:hypothetical protein